MCKRRYVDNEGLVCSLNKRKGKTQKSDRITLRTVVLGLIGRLGLDLILPSLSVLRGSDTLRTGIGLRIHKLWVGRGRRTGFGSLGGVIRAHAWVLVWAWWDW